MNKLTIVKSVVKRIPSKYYKLTAAFLVTVAVHEGFREDAYIPVPGDVPTIGFGTTEDVKMGQRMTPVQALVRLERELENKYAEPVRKCLGETPVTLGEFEALVDLAENVGPGAVCSRAKPNKAPQLMDLFHLGAYDQGCARIKQFNCGPSGMRGVTVDKCGPGKKILQGLVNRREKTYQTCMREK